MSSSTTLFTSSASLATDVDQMDQLENQEPGFSLDCDFKDGKPGYSLLSSSIAALSFIGGFRFRRSLQNIGKLIMIAIGVLLGNLLLRLKMP